MATAVAPASAPAPKAESASPVAARLAGRVASIDAYRGLVMLLMMGEVVELARTARLVAMSRFWSYVPGSSFWSFLGYHQSHVDWISCPCSLHDMIQPSFSLLVGVALPFSLARRAKEGQSEWRRTLHAFWRAFVLVALGVFLRSLYSDRTYWTFEDTLSQIGLGYGFLYLLALGSRRVQWIALAVILVGYWAAFALYPLPGPHFDWAAAGVKPDSATTLAGFAGHWSKNTNLAWAFDSWFLNLPLFNQEHHFNNMGGYVTLSFIPTLATMILGLLAGGVIKGDRKPLGKVGWLAVAGVVGIALGWLLNITGVCPVVKRIWTPSWVLYSGGICFLMLAAFYLVMDVWNRRSWAFVLKVVGMNSIAAYLIAHLFKGFIEKALPRHLGHSIFEIAGPIYQPLLLGAAVLLVEWLVLYWMYRRKIFLRI